jgi:2-amino-4-hydroxy-6-hydroxymethyldihydropteridine diphosphokinase
MPLLSSPPSPVGIALGSNLGDRGAEITAGFSFLQSLAADGALRRSSLHETLPVECPPDSPPFLNAAAEIHFAGSPRDLLTRLQAFERSQGRPERHAFHAPRTLDLDIIYFGDQVVNEADLIIPHPRWSRRTFVLEPLAEICPERTLPGAKLTVAQILHRLRASA